MPKNVRLLKYEVNIWNKKVQATKEALASDVKDGKNGSSVSDKASNLSEELNAVTTGITPTSSNVSVTSSSGSVTCSHCGSVRNTENAVAEHDVRVHEGSSKSDDSKEDLKKLIEEEVRKQIWPDNGPADGRKFSNVIDVGELYLPDVPDESIVKKYTALPAKATDSEIEARLKRLKHDDAEDVNDKAKVKDLDKIVQFKTPRSPKVKDAVDAGKSNPEGNVMMKDLEVDQKCRDDFNTWYWNRVKLKEGKKSVSKSVGTCEGSINEPLTKSSFRKCNDNYHNKYVDNSSESVILVDETFIRSVGSQANVSDAINLRRHC